MQTDSKYAHTTQIGIKDTISDTHTQYLYVSGSLWSRRAPKMWSLLLLADGRGDYLHHRPEQALNHRPFAPPPSVR